MKKRVLAAMLAGVMVMGLAGCGGSSSDEKKEDTKTEDTVKEEDKDGGSDQFDNTTVTIFAAKSLNGVVDELISMYNVVNNQVCVVTYKGSDTKVTGLEDISKAESFALADGSVPVGKYTRQAMVNAGMLDKVDDVSTITTQQVSDALGGIEINECANVGAVTAAVAEGSNEVGTVYKSDTYGLEDKLDILQVVSYDLTGNVIYPIAQIKNEEAEELQSEAALDFLHFLTSDKAKAVYEKYYFDTDVE